MKAVILAAGRGRRLGADDLPKPLWTLGKDADGRPVSFLERQVRCLHRAGVDAIGVVVGWRKETVVERLAPLQVRFVENTHPEIRQSGTTHSLQFAACSAFDPFDGRSAALVLDGDIVYEQALIDAVVASDDTRTALFVAPGVARDTEEVRLYGDAQGPRLIGRGLGPPLTDGLELIGEATGIWKVAAADHALLRATLTWLVGSPGEGPGHGFAGVSSEHEELAQYLITLGRVHAVRLDPGLLFMEVDFREELERARAEIYPEVLRRDAAR